MILIGNRDPDSYLSGAVLQDHTIISILGGFGFLHFVNDYTKSLHLIDRNILQISVGKMILKLIDVCDNIDDFRASLENRTDHVNKLGAQYCAIHDMFIAAKEKYLLGTDWTKPYITQSHINKNRGEFYWRFGAAGCPFADNESFLNLQKQLRSIPIVFHFSDMSKITVSKIQDTDLSIMLVTNADHRYYTSQDRIMTNLRSTIKPNSTVVYRSWNRQVTVHSDKHHLDCVEKIKKHTRGMRVWETKTWAGYNFTTEELDATFHQVTNLSPVYFSPIDTKKSCFLYHLSRQGNRNWEELKMFFQEMLGGFKRIIILDRESMAKISDWIDMFQNIGYHKSYHISHLEWSGGRSGVDRNFILVWDMTGHQ